MFAESVVAITKTNAIMVSLTDIGLSSIRLMQDKREKTNLCHMRRGVGKGLVEVCSISSPQAYPSVKSFLPWREVNDNYG